MTLTGRESWHFLPKTRLQRETPNYSLSKFTGEWFTDRSNSEKLEKAVAVFRVCSGVPEENSGKVAGKLLDIFPESQNAANSRILGTGKGKPATNLGSTLPGRCPHLLRRVFLRSTVPAFSSFSDQSHSQIHSSHTNSGHYTPSDTSVLGDILGDTRAQRAWETPVAGRRARNMLAIVLQHCWLLLVAFGCCYWSSVVAAGSVVLL